MESLRLSRETLFVGALALFCGISAPLRTQTPAAEKYGSFAAVPTTQNVPPTPESGGTSAMGLSSLPEDAQGPISAALGRSNSSYGAYADADGFRAENSQNELMVDFTRHGPIVHRQNSRWALETRAYGYGDAMLPVTPVVPCANGNRVEYRHNRVTEWYINGPLGVEQGFTILEAPGRSNGQPLTVALEVSGDLTAKLEQEGRALRVREKDGLVSLRYTGLKARDATGRELRSWMELREERLLLRVDDNGARFPLVLDPWVQAELTASDGASGAYFGWSVAISGNTAVVGAYHQQIGANPGQGAAYVFVQSAGTWIQQAELIAPDGAANDGFGYSVAVSDNTALVGAPSDTQGSNYNLGAAYLFVRTGTTWTFQGEFTTPGGGQNYYFGYSVAVSGNTVVIGAPGQYYWGSSSGATYVFVQSGGTWSSQLLVPSDGAANDQFGYSVAVSNGQALVGAPFHSVGSSASQGVAYVFAPSGTTWSQRKELSAPDGVAEDDFGWSVAISGNTAAIGAPGRSVGGVLDVGVAYVFTYDSVYGLWSFEAELTAPDAGVSGSFGRSIAVDTVDGNTIVVGAPFLTIGGNNSQGAAYVFVPSGLSWSEQSVLTASNGAAFDDFGYSVAVDGSTAIVGDIHATVGSNVNQGAAYPFSYTVTTVALSPTTLSFGNQALNDTSLVKTVILKNTGVASLTFNTIVLSPNFALSSSTCGSMLAVSKTCKMGITFTPTTLGAVTGTLMLADDATGSPQIVALSGTGITQAALTPVIATYAKQKEGTTSAPKTFTLTNEQPLALTGIVIATTGDFAVSTTTCGTSLAAKARCTIGVTFTPTATGTRTGQLNVSDSANNSPQSASLTGTGTSAFSEIAYVANINSNTVSVINNPSAPPIKTITVGSGPWGVAVSPDATQVYVSNNHGNSVSVIATATNKVIATIAVQSSPFGLSFTPDGTAVYVVNGTSNSVSVINSATRAVVATVPVGSSPVGVAMALTSSGTFAYVSNAASNTVSVIAVGPTPTVIQTINVGSGPRWLAIAPNGGLVYVENANDNSVSVISVATGQVTGTIAVGTAPFGAAFTPDGSRAFVVNSGSNTVSVIETASSTVIGTVSGFNNPVHVALSTDGASAYVTNLNANTVSVFATATGTIADSVSVGAAPIGVAIAAHALK